MAVQPGPTETMWIHGGERTCPECGGPIEVGVDPARPFRLCRPCYDAYVEHAGR